MERKKKNELFVITKTKDLTKYIFTITEKSPKKYRYSVTVRLQNYVLDVLEKLYLANKSSGSERLSYQTEAKNLLSMLDYFCGVAYEIGCILFHQFEYISKEIALCILYTNKWINSVK